MRDQARDGERGMAPLELALGVLAIMVPVTFLVLSFGPWMEHRTFARLAAAEAARLVVTTNGDETAAIDRIVGLAAGSGIDPAGVRIAFCGGEPSPLEGPALSTCVPGGDLVRGGTVTVEIAADVPLVVTPYGPVGIRTTAYRHAESIDLYRSIP